MVASTLTVVSCLHRHASLDLMREVETVQPLAPLPNFGRTFNRTLPSTADTIDLFPYHCLPAGQWPNRLTARVETPRSASAAGTIPEGYPTKSTAADAVTDAFVAGLAMTRSVLANLGRAGVQTAAHRTRARLAGRLTALQRIFACGIAPIARHRSAVVRRQYFDARPTAIGNPLLQSHRFAKF